jgi:hypothetical protein
MIKSEHSDADEDEDAKSNIDVDLLKGMFDLYNVT